jgi:hypothetical protein
MMTRVALCGQDEAMVQVMFDDSDTSPTQAYALARWRENPRISPSSWRQALGRTVGKVAFDGRCGLQGLQEVLAVGCNVVLAPAAALEDVLAVVDARRDEVVVVGFGAAEEYRDGADWWLCPAQGLLSDALEVLERAVKEGRLEAYGISGEADVDLARWLAASAKVAEKVWGRRKRGGLRVVEVPLNGAEQVALRGPDGNAEASILELAARQGMVVMAQRAAHWRGPWGEVEMGLEAEGVLPEALAALVAVGEAEKTVEGLAGGVLPALAAGASPWPTRAAWRVFEDKIWPGLEEALLRKGEEAYVAAWRLLLPHGLALAAMAEGRLAGLLAGQLAACLPETWRDAPVLAQAWGLATSVPGISMAMAGLQAPAARKALVAALERPDVIDVKMALDGVIHRA